MTYDPAAVKEYIIATCKLANAANHRLQMITADDGWHWAWSHGPTGNTTAHDPGVAMLFACEQYNNEGIAIL